MCDSIDCAKYIMYQAKEQNRLEKINLTKLQKLLYICDGVLLAHNHNIIKENARAWEHGPVYPRVYNWYVKQQKKGFDNIDCPRIDDSFRNVANLVIAKFADVPAINLSKWSHLEGSPWDIAMKKNDGNYNGVIDKETIRLYFQGLNNVSTNSR